MTVTLHQPKNFRPAGRILLAKFAPSVPEILLRPRRLEGARAQGVRYERKAKALHSRQYTERYLDGPWLSFLSSGDGPPRYCQPDALLFNLEQGTITVIEYKLSHTDLAWWQLHFLYIPVIEHMFPHSRVAGVEVVKWFDPATKVSSPVSRLREIEAWTSFPSGHKGQQLFVHILRP